MGNTFVKITKHQFPCQICGITFTREIEGPLLCRECSINNRFDMLIDPDEKNNFLLSYATFPSYLIMKNKKTLFRIECDIRYNFHKEVIENIKSLSNDPNLAKRYKLIKSIMKHLGITNYLGENTLKGIYIHNNLTQDILFVHTPDISDCDRIIHINFGGLVKKLETLHDHH